MSCGNSYLRLLVGSGEMKAKMSRDKNGNKTVIVTLMYGRSFAIQTNGNLPLTHKNDVPNANEIRTYIKMYGTRLQKSRLE